MEETNDNLEYISEENRHEYVDEPMNPSQMFIKFVIVSSLCSLTQLVKFFIENEPSYCVL